MFGYSLTRPVHNKDYYYGVFDACEKFGCSIEGWHTESGPGVYEAVSDELELRDSYLLHFLTLLNHRRSSLVRSSKWQIKQVSSSR